MKKSEQTLQEQIDSLERGGRLTLAKKTYELDTTLFITKPINIIGEGATISLKKHAGTVATICITAWTPEKLCKDTHWTSDWTSTCSLSDVTISNLTVKGNLDQRYKDPMRGFWCNKDCWVHSKNELKDVNSQYCDALHRRENDITWDVFSIKAVKGKGCDLKPHRPCTDQWSEGVFNASAILIVNAQRVTLEEVTAHDGLSAGISGFFGCRSLHLRNCTMYGNRFDGFGPDSIVSAKLEGCKFQPSTGVGKAETNACVSVSSGFLQNWANAVPPEWFGDIEIVDCDMGTNWTTGVYINSPNRYSIDMGKINAKKPIYVDTYSNVQGGTYKGKNTSYTASINITNLSGLPKILGAANSRN